MKALILAAGYATRLYPLTKECPKSLLPVKNRPILDYIVDKLAPIDAVDEIIVVTNAKFISLFKYWQKKQRRKKRITLVNDLTKDNATRRGAVGDIAFTIARKKIKDDLLVIGGDNIFDRDLESFLTFAGINKNNPAIGVYNIGNKESAKKYGVIQLNSKGKVIDFKEKPQRPKSSLVAMCLYYFPKGKLRLIREYMHSRARKTDATGFYIDWLRRKVPVFGFVFKGSWYDIGDKKFYNKARETFIS